MYVNVNDCSKLCHWFYNDDDDAIYTRIPTYQAILYQVHGVNGVESGRLTPPTAHPSDLRCLFPSSSHTHTYMNTRRAPTSQPSIQQYLYIICLHTLVYTFKWEVKYIYFVYKSTVDRWCCDCVVHFEHTTEESIELLSYLTMESLTCGSCARCSGALNLLHTRTPLCIMLFVLRCI